MPAHFDLIITADYPNRTAELFLRDSAGVQIGYWPADFKAISVGHQQGLFDLRNYLGLYVEEGKQGAAVAEIGVCIAEEVLGKDIFEKLWASKSQRTLRIQLPGAAEEENHLAAALARVPWEIARPKADAETLGERNLLVRVVHEMKPSASTPIELKPDEALRVLFVLRRHAARVRWERGKSGGSCYGSLKGRSTRSAGSSRIFSRMASRVNGWRRRFRRTAATISSTGAGTAT